jgi:CubicO group peptidase (beta-lactamase class C family)
MRRIIRALAPGLVAALALQVPPGVAAAQQPSANYFAAIDSYVEMHRQSERIPGMALGIVKDGEIVHLRGFGAADGSNRSVTPQTPFLIGSLSKSMTGLTVMQLVEAGKLELDAPVQRYLPWFRVSDADASAQITIRHLLYQTSGFPASAGNDAIARAAAGDNAAEREVRALSSLELSQPVGARHVYSNANYLVLGLLVQTVSGQSYASHVRDHILRPIGMQNSFTSKDDARESGLASGHRYWFGVPIGAELPYPEALLSAGYVISTAEDMARYLAMIQNDGRAGANTILSPAGMAELLRPGAEAGGSDVFYAMGWTVAQDADVRVYGHAGGTFDFRAAMSVMPDQGLGYVLLMNADTALGRGRLTGIAEGVYSLLLGRQPPAPESSPPVLVIYGVLVGAVILQLIGMFRSIVTARRWQRQPERRPHGRKLVLRRLALPAITNLGRAALALPILPNVLSSSLSMLTLQIPDVAYLLIASGSVALIWTALRPLLLARATRTARASSRFAMAASRA